MSQVCARGKVCRGGLDFEVGTRIWQLTVIQQPQTHFSFQSFRRLLDKLKDLEVPIVYIKTTEQDLYGTLSKGAVEPPKAK